MRLGISTSLTQPVRRLGGGIPDVNDANERLSLLGISPGFVCHQIDNNTNYQYNGDAEAVQILGAGTLAANGYYTKRGTLAGKPYYQLLGVPTDGVTSIIYWNGSVWTITPSNAGEAIWYRSNDDVAYPWLVTTWVEQDGSVPVPTTAHIASKNALLTAAFVSEADAVEVHGIYTERPAVAQPDGHGGFYKRYNLLGRPDDANNYAIQQSNAPKWTITDGSGTSMYESSDDVAAPWQVTTWVRTGGSTPNPVVTSVTQGELDAGATVLGGADGSYSIIGVFDARNSYERVLSPRSLLWNGTFWDNNSVIQSSVESAFPWDAAPWTGGAVVSRNDIATEASWLPLP